MTCTFQDLAAASVLASLSPSEQQALDSHLAKGCAECEAELAAARNLAGDLALAVEAAPPANLRDRLLSKLNPDKRAAGLLLDEAGILIKRPEEMGWKSFIPGIDRKMLHTDTDRRYRSYLLKFEPGAKLFKHRHPEVEEILVVSGDVHISGQHMKAGDYCRAGEDSIHEESWSDEGCVLFVVASMDNHLVG
jgi:anti-sigma factor ChrR (cupin superfamily)